jgi:RNA polymerase sigma-70 factor (ECF subfamily)
VLSYKQSLTEFIFKRTRDYHIAEDLTQEAMLRAYRAMDTLESPLRARSWLYSIAYHVTVDWLRYQGAGKRTHVSEKSNPHAARTVPGIDRILIHREEKDQVKRKLDCLWNTVRKLPPRYRRVFELRYRRWHPISRISRKTGLSEGNVKVRLYRARRMLLEALEKGGLLNPAS